jgi:SPP1 gp7 family putative phage head morphogenesis protein
LRSWAKRTSSFEPLGDALFVPSVKADLAGQLMVRGREAHIVKLDAMDVFQTFLDLPWAEALQAFRERVPSRNDELKRLLKGYAQRADASRRLALEQIQAFVKLRLEKHIAEGGLYADFARDLEDGKQTLGITTDDPAYLRMVFRTNVQSAYGAGKFRAATDPDVIEEMPFVQYRTVGDARVRPEHAVLDRGIYHAASDEWHRIAPPNGFSCRCSLVSLSRDDVKGKTILGQVPREYVATPEFDAPPTSAIKAGRTAAPADPMKITAADVEGEAPPANWQTVQPANDTKQMSIYDLLKNE